VRRSRRLTATTVSARHLHVGEIHVDLAARTVDVAATPVRLSRLGFELLVKFASDPVHVFSEHELHRCVWQDPRGPDALAAALQEKALAANRRQPCLISRGMRARAILRTSLMSPQR
jgi:DNA-binding response OmpR family regulator